MIYSKKIYLSILLASVCFSCCKSQKLTLPEMYQILNFNKHIVLNENCLEIPKDTLSYLRTLLKYYKKLDNEPSEYVYYYGKVKPKPIEIPNENSNDVYTKGVYQSFLTTYTKSFTLLFFIENVIIGSNDTLRVISKKNNKDCIYGQINESDIFHSDKKKLKTFFYEKKQIKQIYKRYEKWLFLVMKYGLNYIRKNNIRPLNGTKYYWSAGPSSCAKFVNSKVE